jgi:hypothetical protein
MSSLKMCLSLQIKNKEILQEILFLFDKIKIQDIVELGLPIFISTISQMIDCSNIQLTQDLFRFLTKILTQK